MSGDVGARMAEIAGLARALRGLAEPVLPRGVRDGDAGIIESFVDEEGHRRYVDPFLIASVLGVPAPAAWDRDAPADPGVWACVLDAGADLDAALAPGDSAPLVRHPELTSVEVWTEVELSALHALWNAARRRGRVDLRERCVRAAGWHVRELQPDNATHLPWAVHAFLGAWARTGEWPLRHHAETLVHNCRVATGTPDGRSALILWDAARELEAGAGWITGE